MLLFKWSDQYRVNVEEMDDQHKKLLNLMNCLDEAIQEGKEDLLIGRAVKELNDCVELHLREEETLLERIRYPDINEHKGRHFYFSVQVHMLNSAYRSGDLRLVQSFLQFLKNWLIFHIFSEDRKYGAFLESRRLIGSLEPLKVGNY